MCILPCCHSCRINGCVATKVVRATAKAWFLDGPWTPDGSDGSRKEFPLKYEKVWCTLCISVHVQSFFKRRNYMISANYLVPSLSEYAMRLGGSGLEFPWNKCDVFTKLPLGVRSCDFAIVHPNLCHFHRLCPLDQAKSKIQLFKQYQIMMASSLSVSLCDFYGPTNNADHPSGENENACNRCYQQHGFQGLQQTSNDEPQACQDIPAVKAVGLLLASSIDLNTTKCGHCQYIGYLKTE